MEVTYRGALYTILRYSRGDGRLHIQRTGQPDSIIRRVFLTSVRGLTNDMRDRFGIPGQRRLYTPRWLNPEAPFVPDPNDPILDTEV
jgi:hypothetical protein